MIHFITDYNTLEFFDLISSWLNCVLVWILFIDDYDVKYLICGSNLIFWIFENWLDFWRIFIRHSHTFLDWKLSFFFLESIETFLTAFYTYSLCIVFVLYEYFNIWFFTSMLSTRNFYNTFCVIFHNFLDSTFHFI